MGVEISKSAKIYIFYHIVSDPDKTKKEKNHITRKAI